MLKILINLKWWILEIAEHPVDQLANDAVQAASVELVDWMASGISALRSTNYGLWERGDCVFCGAADPSDTELQIESVDTD